MRKLIKPLIITLFTLLVLAVFVLLLGKQQINRFADQPIDITASQLYEIKPGTRFVNLAADLQQQGVIDDALQLRIYARVEQKAGQIKAGEYQLEPGMTHRQLVDDFVDGKVVQRAITFVEGLTVADYLQQLAAREDEIEQTLTGLKQQEIAAKLGIDGALEGWIYPDTYHFTRNTSDFELLQRAYRRMQTVLDQEWAEREDNLPVKTPYEALILASIVERETGAPHERAEIAGVFTRRLEKGMRLQTDPTVIYGMGARYEGNITRRDLLQHTPYNTYKIDGLPPTPIAGAGRDAIHAVLHPAAGKALYFVARGDGTHKFSATLEEHNEAVHHYQRSNRRTDYRSSPAAEDTGNGTAASDATDNSAVDKGSVDNGTVNKSAADNSTSDDSASVDSTAGNNQ